MKDTDETPIYIPRKVVSIRWVGDLPKVVDDLSSTSPDSVMVIEEGQEIDPLECGKFLIKWDPPASKPKGIDMGKGGYILSGVSVQDDEIAKLVDLSRIGIRIIRQDAYGEDPFEGHELIAVEQPAPAPMVAPETDQSDYADIPNPTVVPDDIEPTGIPRDDEVDDEDEDDEDIILIEDPAMGERDYDDPVDEPQSAYSEVIEMAQSEISHTAAYDPDEDIPPPPPLFTNQPPKMPSNPSGDDWVDEYIPPPPPIAEYLPQDTDEDEYIPPPPIYVQEPEDTYEYDEPGQADPEYIQEEDEVLYPDVDVDPEEEQQVEDEPEVQETEDEIIARHRKQSVSRQIREMASLSEVRAKPVSGESGVVISVTGSHGGAGKSTVSWAMANIAAKVIRDQGRAEDKPVFLIEGDYRNPKLWSRIKPESDTSHIGSLAALLQAAARSPLVASQLNNTSDLMESLFIETGIGLRVLTCPFDFNEHLANRDIIFAIMHAVQWAQNNGSYVFIDAPTFSVQEPLDMSMSRVAHHSVMVTDIGHLMEASRSIKAMLSTRSSSARGLGDVSIFCNRSSAKEIEDIGERTAPIRVVGGMGNVGSLTNNWIGDPGRSGQETITRVSKALSRITSIPELKGLERVVPLKRPPMSQRILGRLGGAPRR